MKKVFLWLTKDEVPQVLTKKQPQTHVFLSHEIFTLKRKSIEWCVKIDVFGNSIFDVSILTRTKGISLHDRKRFYQINWNKAIESNQLNQINWIKSIESNQIIWIKSLLSKKLYQIFFLSNQFNNEFDQINFIK